MTERLGEQKGMRFLRNGLFLGECLNKRFEPSQALAMAILPGEFAASISLPAEDERVRRYLKGETISVEQSEGAVKGWNLFCVDGFPLGWGKWANGNLKNKYYPGWRLM